MSENFWRKIRSQTLLLQTIVEKRRKRALLKSTALDAVVVSSTESTAIGVTSKHEVIRAVASMIQHSTSYYPELFAMILDDMETLGFAQTPSVRSQFDVHIKERYNKHEMLLKIDLFSHTMHVTKETFPLIISLTDKFRAIQLLMALMHDFGKSYEVITIVGAKNSSPHDMVSATYFEKIASDARHNHGCNITKETIDAIAHLLRHHHQAHRMSDKGPYAPKVEPVKSVHLDILNKADFLARDYEISLIERGLVK